MINPLGLVNNNKKLLVQTVFREDDSLIHLLQNADIWDCEPKAWTVKAENGKFASLDQLRNEHS